MKRRLPFRDDMVREILAGRKTVTRRTSDRFAAWRPGDEVDVCEGLRVYMPQHRDEGWIKGEPWGSIEYTADGAVSPDGVWCWQVSRLAPRYCPEGLVRIRLTVEDVRPESVVMRNIPGPYEPENPFPLMDDAEAQREGFPTKKAFVDAFTAINPGELPDMVQRVQFRLSTARCVGCWRWTDAEDSTLPVCQHCGWPS